MQPSAGGLTVYCPPPTGRRHDFDDTATGMHAAPGPTLLDPPTDPFNPRRLDCDVPASSCGCRSASSSASSHQSDDEVATGGVPPPPSRSQLHSHVTPTYIDCVPPEFNATVSGATSAHNGYEHHHHHHHHHYHLLHNSNQYNATVQEI